MDLNYQNARDQLGISMQGAVGFMPYSSTPDGVIHVDYAAMKSRMAQDAALTTAPNVGAPAAYYTYLDPNVVPILFPAKAAAAIFTPTKYGDFTSDYYNFPVEEIAGKVEAYSDWGNSAQSDVNYEWPVRQNFRYQTSIKYGVYETEKMSAAKINIVSSKQRAAAEIISRAENSFQLYGVQGIESYGLLNDPNLNPALTPEPTTDQTPATTWADKEKAHPAELANIVFNDVNKLFGELLANNGGLVDNNSSFTLAISPAASRYLNSPNSFGLTAKGMLDKTYPSINYVVLPELSTGTGESLYLVVNSLPGDSVGTGVCAFSARYQLGQLIPSTSGYEQKAWASTWGCVIRRPSLIARMTGL